MTSKVHNPYSVLAKELNRPRECIQNRLARITNKGIITRYFLNTFLTLLTYPKATRVKKWDVTQLENLWLSMKQVLNVQHQNDLRSRDITSDEWKEIANNMKTKVTDAKANWYNWLYPGLFNGKNSDFRGSVLKRFGFLVW